MTKTDLRALSCPPCTNTCNQGRTCPGEGLTTADDEPVSLDDDLDGLPWGGALVAVPAVVLVALLLAARGCVA